MDISGRPSIRDDLGVTRRVTRSSTRLESKDSDNEKTPEHNKESLGYGNKKAPPIGFEKFSKQNEESSDDSDKEETADDNDEEETPIGLDEKEKSTKPIGWNLHSIMDKIKQNIKKIPFTLILNYLMFIYKKIKSTKWSDLKRWIFRITILLGSLYVGIQVYLIISSDEPASFEVNTPELDSKDIKLEDSIDNLSKEFPSQKNMVWYTFIPGIQSVTRQPNKPSIFLLMYEGDSITAFCLAKKVSEIGIEYIKSKKRNPLIINGKDMGKNSNFLKDSGNVIPEYNETLHYTGAMVVNELQAVPATIAKAFHFFCDRESPLVARSVLFFTLENLYPREKKQISAEQTLKDVWKDLPDNVLDPLITRLTGNVLNINSESRLVGCD